MSARECRHPRVRIATRIFQPEPSAASFRLEALARAFAQVHAHVEVVTSTPPPGMDELAEPGIRTSRWPVLRDESGYVRGYLQYLSFDIPLFLRLLTGRRPDAVVVEPPPTTGMVARVACALRGVPYVYYAADVWSDASESSGTPRWVVKALRIVESHVLRHAAGVIAVSDQVADRVTELGAGRVDVVRNGIDVETFTPEGPLPDEAPGGPYLVYAGTASEWQGAGIFVEAMNAVLQEVPTATLVFLGQGSDWESLRDLAAGLGENADRVWLIPRVSPQVAAAWQRGACATLVSIRPGQGYDLAMPTKILAGVASGVPVVFTGPAGPATELIAGANLGECVAYQVEDVARAMIAALRNPLSQAERMRRASWAREHASVRATGRRAARAVGLAAQAATGIGR